jgi:cytochrome P450
MSLLTVALAVKSDSVKNVRLVRRVLWPGSLPDPAVKAPLPPGSVGCPLAGVPFFWGDREYGAGSFYRTAARKLARRVELRKQREAPAPSVEGPSLSLIPSMFMYYFFGRPFAAVSGRSTLQKLLSLEFEPDGLRSAMRREGPSLMGSTSLITESDRRNHSFLRRLVGQALTPAAVAASVPVLQSASQVAVDQMLREGTGGSNNECSAPIYMDRVCTDFALDVAWRQILGLKSSPDEIPTFVQAVDDWVSGLASIRAILNVGIETSKAWRAKAYLERRVVEKIEDLERNGPDRKSTLSGMLFASDDEVENGGAGDPSSDEGGYRKLTRQQVIDNAMLLILAGSETSASTLTNAMAFLGLHRPVWEKLVDEQRRLQAMLGNELTKDALDRECPYLDAVIRETMRIRPVSGGVPRIAEETLVVNGQQIPKGWFIDWSAALSHELDPKTFQVDGSHMDIIKGFKPERWLSEETAPVDYVPMGAGPRYCLGSVLAYTEMKVFLATLARSIDFELVRDPVDSMRDLRWKRTSIIPKLESGVPIRVRARNPNPVTAR